MFIHFSSTTNRPYDKPDTDSLPVPSWRAFEVISESAGLIRTIWIYRPMLQVAAEGGCGQLLERNPCQATRFHFSCPTRQNSAVCTAPTIAPSAHSARLRGRPTGRGSSRRPSARANPTTNFFDPKGLPVAVCSRSNAKSSASSAAPNSRRHPSLLTRAAQYSRSRIRASSAPVKCALALDQRYATASAAIPARTGFRSTYRIAASRWASSITVEKKRFCHKCPVVCRRACIQ